MEIILSILGCVMHEAKTMALQLSISMKRGPYGPLSQHKIQSHNIAYQVFEDSCVAAVYHPRNIKYYQGPVGTNSAMLSHLS
jgi:hypothetical protein